MRGMRGGWRACLDAILIVRIAIQMPPSRERRYDQEMPGAVEEPIRSEELTLAILLLLAGALGVATTVVHGEASGGAGGLGVVFFIAGVHALRVALRRRRDRPESMPTEEG